MIGIVFIPIGFALLMSSNMVREIKIDYTNCKSDKQNLSCADVIARDIYESCKCSQVFYLDEDYERDVFVYYGLTNFYQNHRRYVKSRGDKQLLGQLDSLGDCEPFAYGPVGAAGKRRPIAPCGAIANSLFNDTFTFYRFDEKRSGGKFSHVPVLNTGIAWATDLSAKFKNPKLREGQKLKDAFQGFDHPPNWRHNIWEMDDKVEANNGFAYEALVVWMRNAALPSFRKLWGRFNHQAEEYKFGLPRGKYMVEVSYNYPVSGFKGTKKLIISNTSWLGGKNPFLGVAYIAIGFICLLLSGVFLFIHRKFGKSTGDLLNITARTPYMTS